MTTTESTPGARALFVVVRVADNTIVGASMHGYIEAYEDARKADIRWQDTQPLGALLYEENRHAVDGLEANGFRLQRQAVAT